MLGNDPETRKKLRADAYRRRRKEAVIASFDRWREARLKEVTGRYRMFGRQVALAHQVLQRWPDCEPAWEALARFYHAEAKLCAALDWLTFAKASIWIDQDSTPQEVFTIWRCSCVAA